MLKAEGVVDVEEEDGLSKTFDLSEQQINKLWGYATMIVRFTSVTEDHAMNFDCQYEMKAGVPYLIKPERMVSVPQFEFNGDNIKVVDEPSSHLMVVAGSSNVNVKVQEDDDEYEEDCNGSRLWDWEGEDGEAY